MDADLHAPPLSTPAHRSARQVLRGRAPSAHVAFNAVLLVSMLTTVTVREGRVHSPGATLLILTLVAWLPLSLRTRWPLVALAGTVAAECLRLAIVPFTAPDQTAQIAMGAYQPVPLATMAAAWTVASRSRRPVAWAAGAAAAVLLFTASLLTQPHSLLATDMVLFDLIVLATGAGVLLTTRRDRAARQERARREDTRRQVVAERLRIARDLHDVLAHHLTLVNAQASVAEYLMRTDSAGAAAALQDISLHARGALDELRATVGLLRQDEEEPEDGGAARHPVPGLDRIDELVGGFRAAGTQVSLTVSGRPRPLPPGGDLAVYRIVEESLTNVTKHAPGAQATVTLRWLEGRLELDIVNGAAAERPDGYRGPGTGHGLIGMRERARSCGGSLTAQARPDGGFAVSATIPEPSRPAR